MSEPINYQDAYDLITPIVEEYVAGRYPGGCPEPAPDLQAIDEMVREIREIVIRRCPELDDAPGEGEDMETHYCGFGCAGLIFLVLVGALCGRGCGRCRCGRCSQCKKCGCCERCCRCGR